MELIIVGNLYAEIALGLYVVRGENVVLLGEIDVTREVPQPLQQVGVLLPAQCIKAGHMHLVHARLWQQLTGVFAHLKGLVL